MGGDSWDKKLCPELPVPLPILLVCLDVDVTLVFAQHLDTTKRSFQVLEDQSQNVTFGGFFNFSLALTWQHKNTKKVSQRCRIVIHVTLTFGKLATKTDLDVFKLS